MGRASFEPGASLPPGETIREAFYHPELGAVLICSRASSLGVCPTYYRTRVAAPVEPYLRQLGDWLWQRIGAGLADGPSAN